MKSYLIKSCFILVGLLLLGIPVQSQGYPKSNFEFAGGFGWPDMASFKIKYGQDFQVGIKPGTDAQHWRGALLAFYRRVKMVRPEAMVWYVRNRIFLLGLGRRELVSIYQVWKNAEFYPEVRGEHRCRGFLSLE